MYKVIIITIALSLSGCSTMGNLIPPSKQSAVVIIITLYIIQTSVLR